MLLSRGFCEAAGTLTLTVDEVRGLEPRGGTLFRVNPGK
jgi:hypothetical protein